MKKLRLILLTVIPVVLLSCNTRQDRGQVRDTDRGSMERSYSDFDDNDTTVRRGGEGTRSDTIRPDTSDAGNVGRIPR
jgi:hypothetical protein